MKALREIVRTCSNAHVARAAVASIGGEFAQRFAAKALRRDLSSGAFAARLVRDFAITADDDEWEGVHEATRGAEQPILTGLRYILDHGLRFEPPHDCDVPEDTPPAWAICASRGGMWRE